MVEPASSWQCMKWDWKSLSAAARYLAGTTPFSLSRLAGQGPPRQVASNGSRALGPPPLLQVSKSTPERRRTAANIN